MQMIDLSGVKDFNAARFLIYWLVATVIAILVAYNIDPQKKLVFAITAGIFIGAGIVWALLIFMILPVLGYHV